VNRQDRRNPGELFPKVRFIVNICRCDRRTGWVGVFYNQPWQPPSSTSRKANTPSRWTRLFVPEVSRQRVRPATANALPTTLATVFALHARLPEAWRDWSLTSLQTEADSRWGAASCCQRAAPSPSSLPEVAVTRPHGQGHPTAIRPPSSASVMCVIPAITDRKLLNEKRTGTVLSPPR